MSARRMLVAVMLLLFLDLPLAGAQDRGQRGDVPRRGARQEPQRRARQQARKRDVDRLMKQFDKNRDGSLDEDEVPTSLSRRFEKLDANQDGKLSEQELRRFNTRSGRRLGELITGPAREERHQDTLQVGDPAPDFTLPDPQGKRLVTLSDFRGKKPVVLIFGSYT